LYIQIYGDATVDFTTRVAYRPKTIIIFKLDLYFGFVVAGVHILCIHIAYGIGPVTTTLVERLREEHLWFLVATDVRDFGTRLSCIPYTQKRQLEEELQAAR